MTFTASNLDDLFISKRPACKMFWQMYLVDVCSHSKLPTGITAGAVNVAIFWQFKQLISNLQILNCVIGVFQKVKIKKYELCKFFYLFGNLQIRAKVSEKYIGVKIYRSQPANTSVWWPPQAIWSAGAGNCICFGATCVEKLTSIPSLPLSDSPQT